MLRHIGSLVLLVALLAQAALAPAALAGVPGGVAALSTAGLFDDGQTYDGRGRGLSYPEAPESDSPRFVHQTMNNCAFASVAMLVDKWTGGRVRPSQDQLRAASGVADLEGAGFSDLARAVAAVNRIDLRFSPRGGDKLTWDQLLTRLGKGAGAVVAGDYSSFPEHYQRWAPGFAALGPKLSGHAVYVERYERTKHGGRVWLMDPLGRGTNFNGEWIDVEALKSFAWRYAGGTVAAAATPEPRPLSGYRIGDPQLLDSNSIFAGEEVSFELPTRVRAGWRRPSDLSLSTTWQPMTLDPDPDVLAAAAAGAPVDVDAEVAAPADTEVVDVVDTDTHPVDTSAPETGAVDTEAPDTEPVDGGNADAAPSNPPEGTGVKPTAPIADADAPTPVQNGLVVAWDERADFLREQQLAREMAWNPEAFAPEEANKGMVEEPDAEPEPPLDEVPDTSPTGGPAETMSALTYRSGALEGTMVAPDKAGTYRLVFELRDADGEGFAEGIAPEFKPVVVHVVGPLAAEYGPISVAEELNMGSPTTVSVALANLGSRDWTGNAVQWTATWETATGSVAAGTGPVEIASGEGATITFDTEVPTDASQGALVVELVTADGVAFSALDFVPVRADLDFDPPLPVATNVRPLRSAEQAYGRTAEE